jgi:hypothetical protein
MEQQQSTAGASRDSDTDAIEESDHPGSRDDEDTENT